MSGLERSFQQDPSWQELRNRMIRDTEAYICERLSCREPLIRRRIWKPGFPTEPSPWKSSGGWIRTPQRSGAAFVETVLGLAERLSSSRGLTASCSASRGVVLAGHWTR